MNVEACNPWTISGLSKLDEQSPIVSWINLKAAFGASWMMNMTFKKDGIMGKCVKGEFIKF